MFEHGFFGNVLSKYYESSDSVINNSNSLLGTIKPGEFFLCVGTAILIGFLISIIYMLTHRKEGYSQSYVLTMIMLPTIVAAILLIINTTAGALTLAGTLTLVRFRSVAGDPKDMAYIFFAMGTGVVCGVGYIGFAVVFFAVLGIILFVLSETDFGGCKKRHMTLKIAIPENLDYQGVFEPVLANIPHSTSSEELRQQTSVRFSSSSTALMFLTTSTRRSLLTSSVHITAI